MSEVSMARGVASQIGLTLNVAPDVAGAWGERFATRFGDDALTVGNAAAAMGRMEGVRPVEALQLAEQLAGGTHGSGDAYGAALLAADVQKATGAPAADVVADAIRFADALDGAYSAAAVSREALERRRYLLATGRFERAREYWGAAMMTAVRLAPVHGGEGAAQIVRGAIGRFDEFDIARGAQEISDGIRGDGGAVVRRLHDELGMPWDAAWAWKTSAEAVEDLDTTVSLASRLVKEFGVDSSVAFKESSQLVKNGSAEGVSEALDALRRAFPEEKGIGLWHSATRAVAEGIPTSDVVALAQRLEPLAGSATDSHRYATHLLTKFDVDGAQQVVQLAELLGAHAGGDHALDRATRLAQRMGPETAGEVVRAELASLPSADAAHAVAWSQPTIWLLDVDGKMNEFRKLMHNLVIDNPRVGRHRHLTVSGTRHNLVAMQGMQEGLREVGRYLEGSWLLPSEAGLESLPLLNARDALRRMSSRVSEWTDALEAGQGSRRVELHNFERELPELERETRTHLQEAHDKLTRFFDEGPSAKWSGV